MKCQSFYIFITFVLATVLLGASGATAYGRGPQGVTGVQAALGTGFTYQGQLKNASGPVNGNCDMAFRLYDALTSGVQVGNAITTTVPVTNGLFTVKLNTGDEFGANAFIGEARWLDIQVRCPSGSGSFAQLDPRQELTAAPYALGLRFGAQMYGTTIGGGSGLAVFNYSATGGDGLFGQTDSAALGSNSYGGVHGVSRALSDGYGVTGVSQSTTSGAGVGGFSQSESGAGVLGWTGHISGTGVRATNYVGPAGTALEIEQGGIRVKGAGIGTSTVVFIHRATAGNTGQGGLGNHVTVIDHPLTNGDPNAILIITPNWNPGDTTGLAGVYNNEAIGVYYTGSSPLAPWNDKWAIFNQAGTTHPMPAGAAFNVLVVKP